MSFKCKWCGTHYCRECLRGDFIGFMKNCTTCRKCSQGKCQGMRTEHVVLPKEMVSRAPAERTKKTNNQPVKKKNVDKTKNTDKKKKKKRTVKKTIKSKKARKK